MDQLLQPNAPASRFSIEAIGATWIGLFLAMWAFSGFAFLPSPFEVLASLPKLWTAEGLGVQLWTSYSLNLEAGAIMLVISYAIAVSTVMPAFRPLGTIVSTGRFNGFVGMPILLMAAFHNAHSVKVALMAYGMGTFTTMALVKMVQDIPREALDHSRTLRMGEWRVVWEAIVLGRFDEVLDILMINLAMGWMMLPGVETMFRFEGGVGALMESEERHLNMDMVFGALLVVLAVGLAQDLALRFIKATMCPHAGLTTERR